VNVGGSPMAVVDLAQVLGTEHTERAVDRKLVILTPGSKGRVGLEVDAVREPVDLPPGATAQTAAGRQVHTPWGTLPLFEPS